MSERIDRLKEILQDVWNLERALAVLGWDEQTYMPPGSSRARGAQLATLARMAHTLFTGDTVGRLLDALEREGYGTGTRDDDHVVRVTRREFERSRLIPVDLVDRLQRAASKGFESWVKAREARDFALFAPALREIVALKMEEADAVAHAGGRYTSLLALSEPGFTSEELDRLFGALKDRLIPLVARIAERTGKVESGFLFEAWDEGRQWEASVQATREIGFDYTRGRLDRSVHPFTTSFATTDVRITTRIDPHAFPVGFFGSLHEMGHGLYEQGLPEAFQGTPVGQPCSSSVHESQSRLFENLVGRSRPFWEFFFPKLKALFPERLGTRSAEEIYRAVNRSEPSLVRVEADEVTYNLHIILRYELEQDLLNGRLDVDDLPKAWTAKMRAHLGIAPPDDLSGVLQDVHWSSGGFAGFPSYTLGNIISVQLLEAVRRDVPDLDGRIAKGDFQPLLGWLRQRVYQEGARYETKELVQRATGEELSVAPYLTYIESKYGEIYGL